MTIQFPFRARQPRRSWLRPWWSRLLHLKSLWAARPTFYRLETLGTDALKDIGLSPSDLPAAKSGVLFSDATRRQR